MGEEFCGSSSFSLGGILEIICNGQHPELFVRQTRGICYDIWSENNPVI